MIILFKFYPQHHFFFNPGSYRELGNKGNYYKESMLYPQQTTILGAIRHLLLKVNGIIGPYDAKVPGSRIEEANRLIGPRSFVNDSSISYGSIKRMSPVFIMKNNFIYHYLPFNKVYVKENVKGDLKTQPAVWKAEDDNKFNLNPYEKNDNLKLGRVEHYSEKEGFYKSWGNINGDAFEEEKLFYNNLQTGITKMYSSQVNENAYYKNVYKGFRDRKLFFGCFVQFEGLDESLRIASIYKDEKDMEQKNTADVNSSIYSQKVGTDSSYFRIEWACANTVFSTQKKNGGKDVIENWEDLDYMIPDLQSNSDRLLCISDVYIEDKINIFEYLDFCLSSLYEFKNVTGSLGSKHSDDPNLGSRTSDKMISRGSILISKPGKSSDLINLLKDSPYYNIGYNHVFPIRNPYA